MSFRIKLLSFLLVQSLLLVGCSGSSDSDYNLSGNGGDLDGGATNPSGDSGSDDGGDDSGSDDGGEDPNAGTSSFSYHSLAVYEPSKDFSGFDSDGLLQSEWAFPLVSVNLINPIIASSQASTTEASAEDYITTVDGLEVDANESFPLLQQIIGTPVSLKTALVFDVSGSMHETDFPALIAEAKAYVAAAQASTDSLIANQEYVVWAFGTLIDELTDGFTSDAVEINAALDQVEVRRENTRLVQAGTLGLSSNLHMAIVEAIGRYQVDPYDFRDASTGDDNDLIDSASSNSIELSQLVLFSSGPDTALEMESSLMVKAIESQGFPRYEGSTTSYTKKPIIYYVIGGETQGASYAALSDEAETTEFLTLTDDDAYSFSSSLILSQLDAITARVDLGNQHVYRVAFVPRVGDHTMVFKSDSSVHTPTLTTDLDADYLELFLGIGTPGEVLESIEYAAPGVVSFNGMVEITGPNGEYLSNYAASLAEVSTFLPATRWVNDEYVAADYEWSFPGADGTGTSNADGSFTVNSLTGDDVILQLENTLLGYTTEITLND